MAGVGTVTGAGGSVADPDHLWPGVQTTTGRVQCMVVGATYFLNKKKKKRKWKVLHIFLIDKHCWFFLNYTVQHRCLHHALPLTLIDICISYLCNLSTIYISCTFPIVQWPFFLFWFHANSKRMFLPFLIREPLSLSSRQRFILFLPLCSADSLGVLFPISDCSVVVVGALSAEVKCRSALSSLHVNQGLARSA